MPTRCLIRSKFLIIVCIYFLLSCLFVLFSGSTDNLTVILASVGGAVAAVAVIAVVVGIIIWRVTSAGAVAATALGPAIASTPVAVSSKPAIHPRFIPSQMHSRGYNGYYNNGYQDNEYRVHPYSYRSKIAVTSDQFAPF